MSSSEWVEAMALLWKSVAEPMKKNVIVLADAASDIEREIDFYDAIEDGVGQYLRDKSVRAP